MTNMHINRSESLGFSGCGPVLYLDFDGVLHHHNVLWSASKALPRRIFQRQVIRTCSLLVELLEPHSAVRIVLSTSWAVKYGCHGAARRLPLELRTRVIGATFHSQMNRAEFESAYRGMQVWADVFRRRPSDWLAIDDDYLQWPAWCRDKLVRSHPEKGLADRQL
jgi:hypothetical protein